MSQTKCFPLDGLEEEKEVINIAQKLDNSTEPDILVDFQSLAFTDVDRGASGLAE